MKWLKRGAIAVAGVLAVLFVVPFFISLDRFIPEIERAASAKLKQPVKVAQLRASLLPLPHATVDGLTVGKGTDMQVGRIVVTPDLMSLAGATKAIRSVEVSGLVLTQKGLEGLSGIQADSGKTAGPAEVRVSRIAFAGATVKLEKVSLGPFDARIDLDDAGTPVNVRIETADGKFRAGVTPRRGGFDIEINAKDWKAPVGAGLAFEELRVKGIATRKDADIGEIHAKLYSGTVSGKLAGAWQQGVQLKGNFDVRQVEIQPLLLALGRPGNVSGRLTASPVLSASAPDAGQIAGSLRLQAPFSIANGVLHRMDISKAATSMISKDGGKGGETRFDRLTGHLAIDRGTRRLTKLDIASGSLSATGNVTISPAEELSGRIEARVAASKLGSAAIPLNVSGTTQTPILLPTGGTVAGAALGTAVLGPGVGTSVGAKAGAWTEGLFGKKDSK